MNQTTAAAAAWTAWNLNPPLKLSVYNLGNKVSCKWDLFLETTNIQIVTVNPNKPAADVVAQCLAAAAADVKKLVRSWTEWFYKVGCPAVPGQVHLPCPWPSCRTHPPAATDRCCCRCCYRRWVRGVDGGVVGLLWVREVEETLKEGEGTS